MIINLPDEHRDTEENCRPHGRNNENGRPNGTQHLHSTSNGSINLISPLFRLPRELRDKIYRHTHVNARPIGSDSSAWDHEACTAKLRPFSCQLSSAALRTCRQWHAEARPLLYGENTFGLVVCARYLQRSVVEQAVDAVTNHFFPLQMVTRFSIIVEVFAQGDVNVARAIVGLLAWALRIPAKLRRLNIDLLVCPFVAFSSRMLESLTSLRKVDCVSFDRVPRRSTEQQGWPGVRANYQLYLKSFMESTSPGPEPITFANPLLHQLFKMYRATNLYIHGHQCEASLELACEAMEECNVPKFKKARRDIIDVVNPKNDDFPSWLFRYDADVDSEIENLRSRSSSLS